MLTLWMILHSLLPKKRRDYLSNKEVKTNKLGNFILLFKDNTQKDKTQGKGETIGNLQPQQSVNKVELFEHNEE